MSDQQIDNGAGQETLSPSPPKIDVDESRSGSLDDGLVQEVPFSSLNNDHQSETNEGAQKQSSDDAQSGLGGEEMCSPPLASTADQQPTETNEDEQRQSSDDAQIAQSGKDTIYKPPSTADQQSEVNQDAQKLASDDGLLGEETHSPSATDQQSKVNEYLKKWTSEIRRCSQELCLSTSFAPAIDQQLTFDDDSKKSLSKNRHGQVTLPSSNKKTATPKTDFERPWAWVIMFTSVATSMISFGQIQSVNIYYLIFLREFGKSSSFTAWISASQTAALCIAGPISSFLLKKLGARLTIFTGSLLMASSFLAIHFANSIPYLIVIYACIGAAESLMSGGNLTAINSYFPKKAAFVTGVMLAGGGLGGMVTGLEIEWAVKTFGWRGAMLLQAGIALQACVCGSCVFKIISAKKVEEPKPEAISVVVLNGDAKKKLKTSVVNEEISTTKSTDVNGEALIPSPSRTSLSRLSLDPFFWLSVLSFMSLQSSFCIMLTIFKGFVVAAGLETSFSTVLTTVGIGSMVGRVFSGPISGLFCAPIYMTVASLTCCVANALYLLATVPWVLAVVGAAFGFFQGQMFVSWLLCMSWVYGQDEMPVVRGHVMFFGVISSLVFPPIAGYTVDQTGNYNIALIMSSAANLCCGICGLVTYFKHSRKSKPMQETNGRAKNQEPILEQLDHCTHL